MSEFAIIDEAPGIFWVQDEILDRYGPEIGMDGTAVLVKILRNARGKTRTSAAGVKTIAATYGAGRDRVRKALKILTEPRADGFRLLTQQGTVPNPRGGSPIPLYRIHPIFHRGAEQPPAADDPAESGAECPQQAAEATDSSRGTEPTPAPEAGGRSDPLEESQGVGASPRRGSEQTTLDKGHEEKTTPYPFAGEGEPEFEKSDSGDPRLETGGRESEVGHRVELTDADIARWEPDSVDRRRLAEAFGFDPAWPAFGKLQAELLGHWRGQTMKYHRRNGNTDPAESFWRYVNGTNRSQFLDNDAIRARRDAAAHEARVARETEESRKKREAEQREAASRPGAFAAVGGEKYQRLMGKLAGPAAEENDTATAVGE